MAIFPPTTPTLPPTLADFNPPHPHSPTTITTSRSRPPTHLLSHPVINPSNTQRQRLDLVSVSSARREQRVPLLCPGNGTRNKPTRLSMARLAWDACIHGRMGVYGGRMGRALSARAPETSREEEATQFWWDPENLCMYLATSRSATLGNHTHTHS